MAERLAQKGERPEMTTALVKHEVTIPASEGARSVKRPAAAEAPRLHDDNAGEPHGAPVPARRAGPRVAADSPRPTAPSLTTRKPRDPSVQAGILRTAVHAGVPDRPGKQVAGAANTLSGNLADATVAPHRPAPDAAASLHGADTVMDLRRSLHAMARKIARYESAASDAREQPAAPAAPPPPAPIVIVKSVPGPAATPRAFLARSRVNPLHLGAFR